MDIHAEIFNVRHRIANDGYRGEFTKHRLHEILDILSELNKEVSDIDPAVKSERCGFSDAECCDHCTYFAQDSAQNYYCDLYSAKLHTAFCRPNQTCKHFHKA